MILYINSCVRSESRTKHLCGRHSFVLFSQCHTNTASGVKKSEQVKDDLVIELSQVVCYNIDETAKNSFDGRI